MPVLYNLLTSWKTSLAVSPEKNSLSLTFSERLLSEKEVSVDKAWDLGGAMFFEKTYQVCKINTSLHFVVVV